MIFNNFEKKLQKTAKKQNSSGDIANYFIKKMTKKEQIESASQISKETSFSLSAVTKFVKVMEYKNILEIIFIQNQMIETELKNIMIETDITKKISKNIEKAANLIIKSRKVFFVGVSNGFSVNLDFSRKLNRLDIWTVVNDSKYEQVGLSNIVSTHDLIIVTSVSLQHSWMSEIMKNAIAPVILLSGEKPIWFKESNIWFNIESEFESTGLRSFTMASRKYQFYYLDKIFKFLLKDKNNLNLIETTRYKRYKS